MKDDSYPKIVFYIGMLAGLCAVALSFVLWAQEKQSQEYAFVPINSSIEQVANSLYSDVETFYTYNMSNLYKNLSPDELKSEGGVCWHYAKFYAQKAKEEKVYGTTAIIDINETVRHEFAIISNNDGYCILDQNVRPLCVRLGSGTIPDVANSSSTSEE